MSEQPQQSVPPNPFANMTPEQLMAYTQKTMDSVNAVQDISTVMAVMELLKEQHIRMTTELPNANYVKQITKYETLRGHQALVTGMKINNGFLQEDFDSDEDKVIKPMVYHFLLAMIPHRRKRALEVIKPLSREPIVIDGGVKGTKKGKFLGIV